MASENPSIESVTIPTRTITLTMDKPSLERRLSMSGHVEIVLDKDEQELFSILVATAEAYNRGELSLKDGSSPPLKIDDEPLVLRVAGGWVRDKLLQLQTHDVDIAVNTLMGVQMAHLVQEYIQKNGTMKVGKIGVICANPAQSKHLETATVKIGGIEVDFCNLRSKEVYEHHSRIPTTSVGTPWEDAMRRDFTVNALFYNLQTRQVEDWTLRGLADLRAGRLVTPLDPKQTFLDDPLRVLRAIRFAVRYHFSLDPAMEDAARNDDIHHALHVKVSRPRVGKELEAMLWSGKGANPILTLRTISRLQLAGSVFSLPIVGEDKVSAMQGLIYNHQYNDVNHDGVRARHVREVGWETSKRFLELYVRVQQAYQNLRTPPNATTYDARLSATVAFLLPFRKLTYKIATKERLFLAVSYIFREGIKFKTKDVEFITHLVESLDDVIVFVTKAATSPVSRLDAGMMVRKCKHLWVTSLLMATIVKLDEQEQSNGSDTIDWIRVSIEVYQTILDMNLDGIWKLKPLLDGKTLIQTLNLPQGPVVGTFTEEQMKWMLMNPQGSAEDCEAHLHSFKRKMEQQDQDESIIGMSDGITSSPISGKATCRPHFDKKMHVESMDL